MTGSTEIAHRREGDVMSRQEGDARAVGIPIEQRMAMLREALTNPEVDPQKAVAMAELMFRLEDRDRQSEFNRDKIAAKKAMPAIFKRGFNSHQKTSYVKFEDLQRAVDPVLERHNLMLDFEVGNVGNDIAVTPILRHINGWVERGGTLKGPPDAGAGRSAIQSVGSSAHYLMRYAAEAMLNLVRDGEDNDGVTGRPGDLLNDRQHGLIAEAQDAAERGEYQGFYQRLNAKDKALLINSGHHARLGGALALPGARAANPDPAPAAEVSGHDISTPEGWVAQYEEDCAAAKTREDLMKIQQRGAKGREKLQAMPALYARATKAGTDALTRLEGEA